jgi:hypothetical protein
MNLVSKGRVKVGEIRVEKLNIAAYSIASGHADIVLTPDDCKCNIIIIVGTPDAGFNVVFNGVFTNYYTVYNNTAQTMTVKNAAGSTGTIATGGIAICFNDGTNMNIVTGGAGTAVTLTGTQTLTNKTLTAPLMSDAIISHNYAGAAADWTLSASELLGTVLMATNANGAVNAIFSTAAPNFYLVDNQTGYALTCKKSGGTGVVVASTKRAILWMNGTDIVRITADA